MTIDTSSFRDPSGQIFRINDRIFRSIFEHGKKDYEAAKESGVLEHLIKNSLIISHRETNVDEAPEGSVYILEHPRLKFISYPYEWPFSMLKDAALLHLEIMDEILPKGFWLRDASAFNVQYDDNGIILIDTLSIGQRIPDSPWIAYRQFCSHFLAPLAMVAYGDIRFIGIWRNYIDGFPLDLAVKVLPFHKKYSPGLFMHLTLHSKFQESADKKEDLQKKENAAKRKVSDIGLKGIINSLKKSINKLEWKASSKIWADYDSIRNYHEKDIKEKSHFIQKSVENVAPEIVWDIGGNTGEYSKIAADNGALVISIDGDPACTEYIYQKVRKEENYNRIYPLTMDLTNPSPGIGWQNSERISLSERGPADLVLALALIHHLIFSGNIPMQMVASWFAKISKHLVVEFMPPTDPMIIKLSKNRPEHHPYSIEEFQKGFGTYFNFIEQKVLHNGRILFSCKKKN